jgi:hypothetical protein
LANFFADNSRDAESRGPRQAGSRPVREVQMMPPDDELRRMAECEALAEKAYNEMYDTRSPAGFYSEMKDCFVEAIGAARRAGRPDEVERLTKRFENCKQVYRKQFSMF